MKWLPVLQVISPPGASRKKLLGSPGSAIRGLIMLPVLVMTLVKLGVLNCEMMRRTRAYAILAIFVIAALITPTPDAFTLCLLAGPMVVLYEICIWLAFLLDRKTARREAEEEARRLAEEEATRARQARLRQQAASRSTASSARRG